MKDKLAKMNESVDPNATPHEIEDLYEYVIAKNKYQYIKTLQRK